LLEKYRSILITRFLDKVSYSDTMARIDLAEQEAHECEFLHRLVRVYVIDSPALAMQQQGQVRILDTLFGFFSDALKSQKIDRLPTRFRLRAERLDSSDAAASTRLCIDIVASLSEPEAVSLFRRVSGQHYGSLLDPMH
jgi:dGTPase